jgi:signal transduction histidine kinase
MKRLQQLNIRQRYHLIIVATLAFAGCLLLVSLDFVIRNYANDYTNRYWQDHTGIFAESAQFGVIMGAKTRTEAVVKTFANNKNVLKAAIYNVQHGVLAENGKAVHCADNQQTFDQSFSVETGNQWCFYAPILQDLPAGALEKQLAGEQKPELLGYVELIVAKTEVNALLSRIMLVAGLVVAAFLTLIFIILRRSSGEFTSPMLDMISVLKQVANRQSGTRVAFSGTQDIVEMGKAFNEVLNRIESNEKILEQTIAERTRELTEALENSQAANRYKTQIVATVSHEMKSPLHVIQNCLAASLATLPDNTENALMRESHQRALDRTAELNDLINNILLHGKLEANSVEVKLQTLDILPLMHSCTDQLAPFLNRQRNSLKLLGLVCTIGSDAELLTHIVNNLLNNACKFTMDGEITLDWRLDVNQFVLQVADTGCGIPAEFQDKIFESFWQVDMSMSRKYGGTGLGLTVTKQFVDLLGGEILVESTEGKGSVFTVNLPSRG